MNNSNVRFIISVLLLTGYFVMVLAYKDFYLRFF